MGAETAMMVPEAGAANGAVAAVENGSLAAVVAGGSTEDGGAGRGVAERSKFWEGKEKMTWHIETHELGRKIEKLLE